MYVYRLRNSTYQVGYYRWDGEELNNGTIQSYQVWELCESYRDPQQAAQRVNYLNGGNGFPFTNAYINSVAVPAPVSPTVAPDPVTGRLTEYYEDPNQARGQF